eukprot:11160239-Prorocentrum_lima.AAC.1
MRVWRTSAGKGSGEGATSSRRGLFPLGPSAHPGSSGSGKARNPRRLPSSAWRALVVHSS